MDRGASLNVDLLSPAARYDPYPLFETLRRSAPVHYDPRRNIWLVSRRADVVRVLRNPAVFSARVASFETTLLGADGTRHLHVRRALTRALAGPRTRQLDDEIARIAERCVESLRGRGGGEAVEELANALTLATSAALIGLAASPLADLRRWSAAILHLGDPWLSTQQAQDFQKLADEFRRFIEAHVARLEPDGAQSDVARLLAGAGDGASLTLSERIDIAMLLVVAGNETTTSLVGHVLAHLIRSPALRQRLAGDGSLIDAFTEEVLRLESPVQRVLRVTTAPTALDRVTLPEGAVVEAILAAANRDEAAFNQPDELRLERRERDPDHLAFGLGTHFCLGARLARLQTRIVVQLYLDRMQDWTCVAYPDPDASYVVRKPGQLRVTCPFSGL